MNENCKKKKSDTFPDLLFVCLQVQFEAAVGLLFAFALLLFSSDPHPKNTFQ